MHRILFAALLTTCLLAACDDEDSSNNTNNANNINNTTTTNNINNTTTTNNVNNVNNTTTTNNVTSYGTCPEMCAAIYDCADIPERDSVLGPDAANCETACGGTVTDQMADCLVGASDCDSLAECLRCQTYDDTGFCDDACTLLVDQCQVGDNYGQCTIDCEMVGSGAMGCFYGADRECWEQAAVDQVCDSGCPQIYYAK